MSQDSARSWVVQAIRHLNKVGSWTGRIHVHKLLFLSDVLKCAKPPFRFELHNFGPYSFALDEEIAQAELAGDIRRIYKRPGYGPSYVALGTPSANMPTSDDEALRQVASVLGDRDSQALELVATCAWAQEVEQLGEPNAVERVRSLKPKFSDAQVHGGLKEVQKLREAILTRLAQRT